MRQHREWTTAQLHRAERINGLLATFLAALLFYGFAALLGAWLNGAHFDTSGTYGSSLTLVLDRTIEDGRLYAVLLLVIPLVFGFRWFCERIPFFLLFLLALFAWSALGVFACRGLGQWCDARESAALAAVRASDAQAITGSVAVGSMLAMLILCVLQIIVALYRKTRAMQTKDAALPPFWTIALFAPMDLGAWLLGRTLLMRLLAVLFVLWLLVHVAASVRIGRARFLSENIRTANLPAEQITAVSRASQAALLLASALLALLLHLLPLERLLPYLEGLRQGALSLLGGFFARNPVVEEAQRQTLDFSAMDAGASGIAELLPAEPNPVLVFLADVLLWVVVALIAFAVAAAIFRAVQKLYRGFYSQGKLVADETESLVRRPMTVERLNADSEGRLPLLRGTPSQKVRRLYRQYHRRHASDRLQAERCTPTELETERDAASAARIRLYEKARYSEQGAGEEDVAEMKKSCRV